MNRHLAPERRARDLAATVRNHFVYIHIELRATARHPHMQREHFVMLTREDLVADLNDQLMALIVKPLAVMIGIRGAFLQDGVRGNHLPRDQVFADAEVLKRTLRLRTPEFVSSDIHFAETIAFFSNVCHLVFPFFWNRTVVLSRKTLGLARYFAGVGVLPSANNCLSFPFSRIRL